MSEEKKLTQNQDEQVSGGTGVRAGKIKRVITITCPKCGAVNDFDLGGSSGNTSIALKCQKCGAQI